MSGFESLGLSKWVKQQCDALGYAKPTPVQAACIPPILNGSNVYGKARTGSGKTAAFALPILDRLSREPYGVYCLVVTPTRELAIQIGEQFQAFGKPIGIRCEVVIGGMDMIKQAIQLNKRPHVVVATPGRLAEHIRTNETVHLKRLKYFVLDEADRLMTNESLQPDLEDIAEVVPKSAQTLCFGATMPDELSGIVTDRVKTEMFRFEEEGKEATVETLKQYYVVMPSQVRHAYFINVMRSLDEDETKIVFTSTAKSCEELTITLKTLGFRCVSLHSYMPQSERVASLAKFKSGVVNILVSTDVASRGIDIFGVGFVINFNTPKSVTTYIQRVGRTARAGKDGSSITMVSEHDVALVHAIEAKTTVKLELYDELTEKEVMASLNEVNIARRKAMQQMTEDGFEERYKERKDKQRKSKELRELTKRRKTD